MLMIGCQMVFPSQSCLLRFSHQIVYTNIERTRRHKNVPWVCWREMGRYVYICLAQFREVENRLVTVEQNQSILL